MKKKKLIARDEALEIVRIKRFGDWAAFVTPEQEQIFYTYVLKPKKRPAPPDMLDQVHEVIRLYDTLDVQNGEAIGWLEKNGFDCVPKRGRNGRLLGADAVVFDRFAFEAALKNCLPVGRPHSFRPKPKAARGPKRGTGRYAASDRRLYPEIERLVAQGLTETGATLQLEQSGKIESDGATEPGSLPRRLRNRWRRERP